MIWYVCFILTALILVYAVVLSLNKRLGIMRLLLIFLFLFLAAYIIYIPPFLEEYDIMSGLIGVIINTLQVISLDADYLMFYELVQDGIRDPIVCRLYMAVLGMIHFLLPLISAVTAVTVILRCFASLQVWIANCRKRTVYVFSEMNDRSLRLAEDLRSQNCDIIFAGCDEQDLGSRIRQYAGYILKEEKITELDIRSKKGKQIYYFCISEDEDEALNSALLFIERGVALAEEMQVCTHIFLFGEKADYSAMVDSVSKGRLDIRLINEDEIRAYDLMDIHPLYESAKDGRICVLLYGLGAGISALLKAILWCGQLPGLTLEIHVAGVEIDSELERLKLCCPCFFTGEYAVYFHSGASEYELLEILRESCKCPTYIVVSGENDNESIEKAMRLRRWYYLSDRTFTICPPIYVRIDDSEKARMVERLRTAESNPDRQVSYGITPFGSLDDLYTSKNLVDSDLDKLSRNVHLAYEEIFSSSEIEVGKALERYNIFEVNKRSNRANALHIRYKLYLLGLDYTMEKTAEEVCLADYLEEELLERLAVSEHRRWMAFLETEGWIPASMEDVEEYRNTGLSRGRHNCPILKMHPYICEYQELKERSLKLEGKDTTVYDKELILRIPDILGDKWQIAGQKYKIVKRIAKEEI